MNGKWMTRLGNNWRFWQDWFFDLLFPKNCLRCGREGEWLCESCRPFLKLKSGGECPVCRQPQFKGNVCKNCFGQSYLDGLWVLADYDDKLVRQIIHLIKYNFVVELADIFEYLMKDYFFRLPVWQKDFILLPVPLHRRRYLVRGFNQATLLAQAAQRVFGNQIGEPVLRRRIYRQEQAKLPLAKRLKNVKDNFEINPRLVVHLQKNGIILIDDVYTTGATMQECAKVLKKNGFSEIWGLVMARG